MAELNKRILAGGTVTVRVTDGTPEVLLVHRPRYDDWTLPKGKLEVGEHLAACAARETAEESSVSVRLGLPVGEITYPISSGIKAVSYWVGHPTAFGKHRPNSEVDTLAWFSVTSALRQTSYVDERELIRRAVNLPTATPLIILRHAKAMSRSDWSGGADVGRPLDERGRNEARDLIPLLGAYGVARVVSSSAERCVRTVRPFAKAQGLDVDLRDELTEEAGAPRPKKVSALLADLARETAASGVPTVVCGHRPVLPAMFAGVGVEPTALNPAAAMVVHLDANAKVVAVELHRPQH
jgi:8-oxo-dGTP diphosphatase